MKSTRDSPGDTSQASGAGSPKQPDGRTLRADVAHALLSCLALYYPLEWLANSLLWVLPSLARVLAGGRVADLQILPIGMTLAVTSAGGTGRHPFSDESTTAVAGMIAVVVVVALVLNISGRQIQLLRGLALAVVADSALVPWFWRILTQHHGSAAMYLGSAVFFAILCLGLHWMASTQPALGRLGRLGFLVAGFAVLPALVVVALVLLRTFFFRHYGLYIVLPGTVAALLVSFLPSKDSSPTPRLGWRPAAIGAVISLLLGFGSPRAGHAVNRFAARERIARSRAALASVPVVPPEAPYPKLFFQKGVNFTAEWPDPYASLGAQQMLAKLPLYGINAIALVPYGWYTEHSPPRVHIQEGDEGWESDEGIAEMTRLAHHLGMKVMLKPAIWDAFNQEYSSPQDRAQWFAQYQLFLEHYARLATRTHADLLVIGGEFTHLTAYDAEWRKLISRARELYPGPLVYAANFGDEFEHVSFWDALDYIGLQEYYPLPDDLSTSTAVARIEAVEEKYHKSVIFTEAGFASLKGANRAPWDDSTREPVSPELQAQCYKAVFKAFYQKPWFEGVYWWKVETNGSGGPLDGSHSMWEKPALLVMKQWYLAGGR